jgi:hypothetical protein
VVQLRVSGTIRKATGVYAKPGSIIAKHAILIDPTVSSPTDIFIQQFFIASTLTKLEFVDPRSGAVLYSATQIEQAD